MKLVNACVYTCLMGDYEGLNELDGLIEDDGTARICFTDDPSLESDTWEVRVVSPALPMDSVRSQRRVKMLAHEYLPDFDVSLYIDNTVGLRVAPGRIIEECLGDADMAMPIHGFRESVLDEFLAVAKFGLDEPSRIFEQLNHYQLINPDGLQKRPYWAGIILRRHNRGAVRAAMETWYEHVMRYSRRDQLSIIQSLDGKGVDIRPIEVSNHSSWFHQWPIINDRDQRKRSLNISMSGASLLAQARFAEAERLDEIVVKHNLVLAEKDREITGLNHQLADYVRRFDELATEHDRVVSILSKDLTDRQCEIERLRDVLQSRDASIAQIYKSASWRITRPLRGLRRRLARSSL